MAVRRRFVKIQLKKGGRQEGAIYLTQEILDLIDYAVNKLGITKSELFRLAILEWLDRHSLITERLHS
jgi:hypothetical protein